MILKGTLFLEVSRYQSREWQAAICDGADGPVGSQQSNQRQREGKSGASKTWTDDSEVPKRYDLSGCIVFPRSNKAGAVRCDAKEIFGRQQ